MSNFILLIVCLALGMILKRIPTFPKDAHLGLNGFIIYIALPAIALSKIPEIAWGWGVVLPLLSGWLVLLFSVLFFKGLNTIWKLDQKTLGCLILVCGLGNTSFVGFPIVEALYGSEGLSIAVLVDQGTFLALSIGGVSIAMIFSEGQVNTAVILKRLISFPPFLAFVLALFLIPLGGFPSEIKEVLDKLGSTLTPLALVSVGLQLNFKADSLKISTLGIGLTFKLLIAPFLIYLLYVRLLGQQNMLSTISVIESAMAPMVTASILATQYKLNAPLANLLVGLGILLSLLTIWIWWFVL
jgi:hypothetical protein